MTETSPIPATPALRLVFDTNVIVSALLLNDSIPRRVFDYALIHAKILLSSAMQAELYAVLNRSKFRRYIEAEDIRLFLASLGREAEWVDVTTRLVVCRDPKDDKFLELAVSGKATHLVTGDSDLLVLETFRGIEILRPRDFLDSVVPKQPKV